MSGWVTITSKRPFFHAIPRHFSTFWWTPSVFPSGLRGLGPKGGIGVLGYPHPYSDSLPGHPSTQLLDQYHNALHLVASATPIGGCRPMVSPKMGTQGHPTSLHPDDKVSSPAVSPKVGMHLWSGLGQVLVVLGEGPGESCCVG